MLRSLVRHAHMGGGAPSQVAFRKAAEKVTIGAGSSSGRIALRNAVEKSMISRSISETAPRVLSLQRDLLRSVPWIKRAYAVIMPESVRRRPSAIDAQPNPPRPALPQRSGAFQLPDRPGRVCLPLNPSPITLSRTPAAHPPTTLPDNVGSTELPAQPPASHTPHRAPNRCQEMRQHISKTFRDKKGMTDVAQVSKMVAYGRMELEETLMLCEGRWQKSPLRTWPSCNARGRCVRSAPARAGPCSRAAVGCWLRMPTGMRAPWQLFPLRTGRHLVVPVRSL